MMTHSMGGLPLFFPVCHQKAGCHAATLLQSISNALINCSQYFSSCPSKAAFPEYGGRGGVSGQAEGRVVGAELATTRPSTICHPVLLARGPATIQDPRHQRGGDAAPPVLGQNPIAAPWARGGGSTARGCHGTPSPPALPLPGRGCTNCCQDLEQRKGKANPSPRS